MTDTLRPDCLDEEFHGQPKLKERLFIHISSARQREKPLEHILLTGPPGTGKTTVAELIAEDLGDEFLRLTMPVTETVMAATVSEFHGILLLDELHRLPTRQQENLLDLLEFGYLSTSRGHQIPNKWLTIVGATTEPQDIIPPLTDRFPIKPVYEPYSTEDMTAIVAQMLDKAEVTLSPATIDVLAGASAGIPRNARKLVLAARDLWAVWSREPTAEAVLDLCGISADGLTETHVNYLLALKLLGGTAGLGILSTTLRLHETVILDLERLLLTKGLISYSQKGRELTNLGVRRTREAA